MGPEQLEAAARLRAFRALGGVDLDSIDPAERSALLPEVHTGTVHFQKAIFQFVCPLCGNRAENDQQMAPVCTGPHWYDEHPYEIMELVR